MTKEQLLSENIASIAAKFEEYPLDVDTLAFSPAKPFNTEMYAKFWPVSSENGQNTIFINHCSGIKLAPTALFTHVKAPMLKRRSKEVATNGAEGARDWFSKQDRPPKDEKINAFQKALNQCGDRNAIIRGCFVYCKSIGQKSKNSNCRRQKNILQNCTMRNENC